MQESDKSRIMKTLLREEFKVLISISSVSDKPELFRPTQRILN
jgi:hypothetical protein